MRRRRLLRNQDGILGCCPIGSECDAGPIPGCQIHALGLVVMRLVVGRVQLLARQCQAIRGRRVGFVKHIRHLKRQERQSGDREARHMRSGSASVVNP